MAPAEESEPSLVYLVSSKNLSWKLCEAAESHDEEDFDTAGMKTRGNLTEEDRQAMLEEEISKLDELGLQARIRTEKEKELRRLQATVDINSRKHLKIPEGWTNEVIDACGARLQALDFFAILKAGDENRRTPPPAINQDENKTVVDKCVPPSNSQASNASMPGTTVDPGIDDPNSDVTVTDSPPPSNDHAILNVQTIPIPVGELTQTSVAEHHGSQGPGKKSPKIVDMEKEMHPFSQRPCPRIPIQIDDEAPGVTKEPTVVDEEQAQRSRKPKRTGGMTKEQRLVCRAQAKVWEDWVFSMSDDWGLTNDTILEEMGVLRKELRAWNPWNLWQKLYFKNPLLWPDTDTLGVSRIAEIQFPKLKKPEDEEKVLKMHFGPCEDDETRAIISKMCNEDHQLRCKRQYWILARPDLKDTTGVAKELFENIKRVQAEIVVRYEELMIETEEEKLLEGDMALTVEDAKEQATALAARMYMRGVCLIGYGLNVSSDRIASIHNFTFAPTDALYKVLRSKEAVMTEVLSEIEVECRHTKMEMRNKEEEDGKLLFLKASASSADHQRSAVAGILRKALAKAGKSREHFPWTTFGNDAIQVISRFINWPDHMDFPSGLKYWEDVARGSREALALLRAACGQGVPKIELVEWNEDEKKLAQKYGSRADDLIESVVGAKIPLVLDCNNNVLLRVEDLPKNELKRKELLTKKNAKKMERDQFKLQEQKRRLRGVIGDGNNEDGEESVTEERKSWPKSKRRKRDSEEELSEEENPKPPKGRSWKPEKSKKEWGSKGGKAKEKEKRKADKDQRQEWEESDTETERKRASRKRKKEATPKPVPVSKNRKGKGCAMEVNPSSSSDTIGFSTDDEEPPKRKLRRGQRPRHDDEEDIDDIHGGRVYGGGYDNEENLGKSRATSCDIQEGSHPSKAQALPMRRLARDAQDERRVPYPLQPQPVQYIRQPSREVQEGQLQRRAPSVPSQPQSQPMQGKGRALEVNQPSSTDTKGFYTEDEEPPKRKLQRGQRPRHEEEDIDNRDVGCVYGGGYDSEENLRKPRATSRDIQEGSHLSEAQALPMCRPACDAQDERRMPYPLQPQPVQYIRQPSRGVQEGQFQRRAPSVPPQPQSQPMRQPSRGVQDDKFPRHMPSVPPQSQPLRQPSLDPELRPPSVLPLPLGLPVPYEACNLSVPQAQQPPTRRLEQDPGQFGGDAAMGVTFDWNATSTVEVWDGMFDGLQKLSAGDNNDLNFGVEYHVEFPAVDGARETDNGANSGRPSESGMLTAYRGGTEGPVPFRTQELPRQYAQYEADGVAQWPQQRGEGNVIGRVASTRPASGMGNMANGQTRPPSTMGNTEVTGRGRESDRFEGDAQTDVSDRWAGVTNYGAGGTGVVGPSRRTMPVGNRNTGGGLMATGMGNVPVEGAGYGNYNENNNTEMRSSNMGGGMGPGGGNMMMTRDIGHSNVGMGRGGSNVAMGGSGSGERMGIGMGGGGGPGGRYVQSGGQYLGDNNGNIVGSNMAMAGRQRTQGVYTNGYMAQHMGYNPGFCEGANHRYEGATNRGGSNGYMGNGGGAGPSNREWSGKMHPIREEE
ncbi:hypothetical protein M422DRAFT_252687 [Sphaerobolus stellatus SS14]|uniref:Uncharacterized protein n=1 Tax=Sphaerobolus stellatus (strain SS14) TaxID=990650 RepID=A0A0C9VP04_SPHS4|nr:hypothetical protein M422DRAFT_252687 [Sphaerobolus stellatus SS14]